MKISKNSWHYRFNSTVSPSSINWKTHTTCSYIRTTLWNMMVGLLMLAFCCAAISALIGVVACGVYYPIAIVFGLPLIAEVVKFGSIFWLVLGGGAGCFGIAWLWEKGREKIAERRNDRELSLLLQAAEDRKNGICTIVEFV